MNELAVLGSPSGKSSHTETVSIEFKFVLLIFFNSLQSVPIPSTSYCQKYIMILYLKIGKKII
jgi:hypothetical protein